MGGILNDLPALEMQFGCTVDGFYEISRLCQVAPDFWQTVHISYDTVSLSGVKDVFTLLRQHHPELTPAWDNLNMALFPAINGRPHFPFASWRLFGRDVSYSFNSHGFQLADIPLNL